MAVNRRALLTGAAALTAAAGLTYPRHVFAQSEKNHPPAGRSINMAILGIAGWLPSKLGVDMSPEFAKYAKSRYGCDVSFSFADAPFGQLFQKAATSLATRSAEYSIIISDSQWLGALATPKWIVPLNPVIAQNKGPRNRVVRAGGARRLSDLPGRHQQPLRLPAGRRRDSAVRPPRPARSTGRGGGVQGALQPRLADDLGGLREALDRGLRQGRGVLHPAGQGLPRHRDAVFARARLHQLSVDVVHAQPGGDIWDPSTGQVQGIYDTDVNARAMAQYKDLLKFQPPGAINYGIAEIADVFTQGKAFSAWQ